MTIPQVSVIMGVYNCEKTLGESIESILNQTFLDWELIICDDGSSDETLHIARLYENKNPDKIKVITNNVNLGLNKTLNRCLKEAKGAYIARQDGDDISLEDRFEKEVEILNRRPDLSIVSCAMIYFDESGEWGKGTPVEFPEAKDFMNGTPFCHAPSMVRKKAFELVGGYRETKITERVEDYDLWIRLYEKGCRGQNILEPLYKMLDDRLAIKRRKYRYRINEAYMRLSAIKKFSLPLKYFYKVVKPLVLGLAPTKIYTKLHYWKLDQ